MAIEFKRLAFADELHTAVTIDGTPSPLSLSGQAISLKNNAGSPAAITAVDTGTLADSDTVIPTSKAVLTKIGAYLPLAGGTMSGNIVMPDGGTIGQSAGPLLTFDDTSNILKVTGSSLTINSNSTGGALVIEENTTAHSYGAYVGRTVTQPSDGLYGMGINVRDIATSGHSGASYGMIFGVYVGAADGSDSYNRTGSQYGVQGFTWHYGTGTCSSMIGGYFGCRTAKAGGTISNVRCVQVTGGNTNGINATITNYSGVYVSNINDSGTITNDYGVLINCGLGTNRYGLRITDFTGGSVNFP